MVLSWLVCTVTDRIDSVSEQNAKATKSTNYLSIGIGMGTIEGILLSLQPFLSNDPV